MGKNTLKDMKKANRRLLIQTLTEGKSLSRIEMAHITDLSPSTISSLTAELINEGIFQETGRDESTGGRKRTGISLNGNFARIAAAEIRRNGAVLRIYDMETRELESRVLARGKTSESRATEDYGDRYFSGDELFALLVKNISGYFGGRKNIPLGGIGLLFQEDMSPGEFSVFYSTSLSSDTISLKDALVSHFHVPVIEEYSQSFSISSILSSREYASQENAALVNIGRRVSTGIALRGIPVILPDGRNIFNITPLVREDREGYSLLAAGRRPFPEKPWGRDGLWAAARALVRGLKPLCVFFQLDTVFLEGFITEALGFTSGVERALRKELGQGRVPKILHGSFAAADLTENLARTISRKILLGI
ncbi:MAG: hypothetical protein LBS57_02880 [Treponema sp.]|jgi:hypothetical protein|nr:hypothetical protein [Treponema sp.]